MISVADAGLRGRDDLSVLAWAAAQGRAVVTNNIRDFRPLHAGSLSAAGSHHGIGLVPSSKFTLRLDALGPIVTALDRLLSEHPADSALLGREVFL